MTVSPLNDKIVVKVAKKGEEVLESGIVLTTALCNNVENQGEVIAVGPGRVLENSVVLATETTAASVTRLSPVVKVGDRVIFNPFAPTITKVDGEDLYILGENDILAVIS